MQTEKLYILYFLSSWGTIDEIGTEYFKTQDAADKVAEAKGGGWFSKELSPSNETEQKD